MPEIFQTSPTQVDFLQHYGHFLQKDQNTSDLQKKIYRLYSDFITRGPKVKSDHTKRIPVHDFLYVGLPSQTSRTINKRVISTFKFGYPRLTLKAGSKVKSDHTKRIYLWPSTYMQDMREIPAIVTEKIVIKC